MIIIQFLKEQNYLQKFSKAIRPFTKIIGLNRMHPNVCCRTSYWTRIWSRCNDLSIEEDGVSKKDATLAFIFLVAVMQL